MVPTGKETNPSGGGDGGHPGPSPHQGCRWLLASWAAPLMGLREAHPELWDQEPLEGIVKSTLRTVSLGNKNGVSWGPDMLEWLHSCFTFCTPGTKNPGPPISLQDLGRREGHPALPAVGKVHTRVVTLLLRSPSPPAHQTWPHPVFLSQPPACVPPRSEIGASLR